MKLTELADQFPELRDVIVTIETIELPVSDARDVIAQLKMLKTMWETIDEGEPVIVSEVSKVESLIERVTAFTELEFAAAEYKLRITTQTDSMAKMD